MIPSVAGGMLLRILRERDIPQHNTFQRFNVTARIKNTESFIVTNESLFASRLFQDNSVTYNGARNGSKKS
jgi:hypothetical protein